ncbi:MAG: class I SAM-dependent methyltransferase [Pyrinomonadaceae bacterium]
MSENALADLTYEDFPYPGMTFRETHPDSIAAVASFYRLNTQTPENCRVLELGCGNGSNLLWMASGLPESEFIGIDLSRKHIEEANESAAALNLRNAEFYQKDILGIDGRELGKFDYIIAHGLFSWVPDSVCEKVFQLYGELLAPKGVGYVSFNVLPGYYLRQIMREAMQFHLKDDPPAAEGVKRARNFAEFLSETTHEDPLYNYLLKSEFRGMIDRDDSVIFHDDLSVFNNAFLFSDFISRAEDHGLQFLSESERLTSLPYGIPADVLQFIDENSKNLNEREQYIDLFSGTNFRRTLLCRDDIEPIRDFDPEVIKTLFVSTPLRPDSADPASEDRFPKKFTADPGFTIEIDHILTRAFLTRFASNEFHEIPFKELIDGAIDELNEKGVAFDDRENEIRTTVSTLTELFSKHLIRFHVSRSAAINYLPEKPKVSDYVRMRAQKGNRVATVHGLNLELSDDFTRELFILLTGERTRDELIAGLVSKLYNDDEGGIGEFSGKTAQMLDSSLDWMVRVGFII